MKNILKFFIVIGTFIFFSSLYAAEYEYASEQKTQSWTQVVVPDDISWTQRFILWELKELRVDQEALRREINQDLNTRELAIVDRALSYSGNTVNFLWLIITMAVTGFWLVGWKTMRDVRQNLTANFEREIQKNVRSQQKRLEEFMKKFEEDQLSQSAEILKNQEFIQKKQESAFYWSQFNREEDPVQKLELLDKVLSVEIEDDEIFVLTEKSSIYTTLGLWDKALETAEKWLEQESENTSLLYSKAQSLVMLEDIEEALKVVNNILIIKPGTLEEFMEDPIFENLHKEIEDLSSDTLEK